LYQLVHIGMLLHFPFNVVLQLCINAVEIHCGGLKRICDGVAACVPSLYSE
jgi:hypothetical protein